MNNDLALLKKSLQKYWGYEDFRHPQAEIVQSILSGRDCLVVMPTGGGKSLCFQLPALLQEGLTLVVSPLVALMENQVQELREKQLPATIIHSEISKADRKQILHGIEAEQYRLLYLSPETLLSPSIWQIISQLTLKINGLILDEAHCLAQWGDSFRPAYERLGVIRSSLVKHKPTGTKIPLACFTATADKQSRLTIVESLGLKSPKQFLLSPYRDNLQIKVQTIWTPKGRNKALRKFIEGKNQQSGLIYVRTRQDSQTLSARLNDQGYKTYAYHAGLSAIARRKIESDWLKEKVKFVVCTSAFGMGINKPNLRWICHYQAPGLLSEYIQEIGRGGRDGNLSQSLTLISEPTGLLNPEDKQRQNYFLEQQIKQYHSAEVFLSQIPATGHINDLLTKNRMRNTDLYLGILHRCQQLRWVNPHTYRLTLHEPKQAIQELIERQKTLTKQTHQYLTTKDCRWHFLLSAFDFVTEDNFRCGKCDNCLKSD